MDVLTVVLSVILAIPVQLSIMFLVYSKWILPAINQMVSVLPGQVRSFVEPFVNEKLEEITKSVKMSSARFQRTVNQAAAALDLDEVDLGSDDGIEAAKETLSKRYGMDVAIQAVTQLITSMKAKQEKAEESKKGVSTW